MTEKEERFVEEMILQIDGNATAAAIRARYSKKSARVIACQLLKKQKIIKRIEERKKEIGKSLKITPERVKMELAALAFSNVKHYKGRSLSELTGPEAAAIKKVETAKTLFGDDIIMEVTLHDKPGILLEIGRWVGLDSSGKDGNISYDEKMKLMSALMQSRDVGKEGEG